MFCKAAQTQAHQPHVAGRSESLIAVAQGSGFSVASVKYLGSTGREICLSASSREPSPSPVLHTTVKEAIVSVTGLLHLLMELSGRQYSNYISGMLSR